jgi:hypothetical protein
MINATRIIITMNSLCIEEVGPQCDQLISVYVLALRARNSSIHALVRFSPLAGCRTDGGGATKSIRRTQCCPRLFWWHNRDLTHLVFQRR